MLKLKHEVVGNGGIRENLTKLQGPKKKKKVRWTVCTLISHITCITTVYMLQYILRV